MKKLLFILLTVIMIVVFSACSTKTKGRSPVDGTWDNVKIYNGGLEIWNNLGEDGRVTISSTESKNHSLVTSEGTWIVYTITCDGDVFYVLDCESLTFIVYNN